MLTAKAKDAVALRTVVTSFFQSYPIKITILLGKRPFCEGVGCGFAEGSKRDAMLLLMESTEGIPIEGNSLGNL